MTKRYVVAILEVDKTEDNITVCKTGCITDGRQFIIAPIHNELIVKKIVVTQGTAFCLQEIIDNLRMQIK